MFLTKFQTQDNLLHPTSIFGVQAHGSSRESPYTSLNLGRHGIPSHSPPLQRCSLLAFDKESLAHLPLHSSRYTVQCTQYKCQFSLFKLSCFLLAPRRSAGKSGRAKAGSVMCTRFRVGPRDSFNLMRYVWVGVVFRGAALRGKEAQLLEGVGVEFRRAENGAAEVDALRTPAFQLKSE